MKTILCYGDSNLRGFIPGTFDPTTGLAERYIKSQRWTGVLQNKLGDNFNIVEEGINGRTTLLDEIIPGRPYRNGLTYLPFCLESHYPVDLVIFLLGTNDLKNQFNKSPEEISENMRALIRQVKHSTQGPLQNAPKILVISPQPIIKIDNLHIEYAGEPIEKSKKLSSLYKKMTAQEECAYIDAGAFVTSSKRDGIHLEQADHTILGNIVAEKVASLFK